MAKKNSWLVWVIAIIAVAALVLSIIAVCHSSLTGNSIFSFFKKSPGLNQAGQSGCSSSNLPSLSKCGSPANGDCTDAKCDTGKCYCYPNGDGTFSHQCCTVGTGGGTNKATGYSSNVYGVLGASYLTNNGDANALKGYEVKYDSNGNLIYEITDGGKTLMHGENYTVNQTNNHTVNLAGGGGEGQSSFVCMAASEYCGPDCPDTCHVESGLVKYGYPAMCLGTCYNFGCGTTFHGCGWVVAME